MYIQSSRLTLVGHVDDSILGHRDGGYGLEAGVRGEQRLGVAEGSVVVQGGRPTADARRRGLGAQENGGGGGGSGGHQSAAADDAGQGAAAAAAAGSGAGVGARSGGQGDAARTDAGTTAAICPAAAA